MASPTVMFLYSKATFSTDRKLTKELWKLKVPPAVPYIVKNLTKLKQVCVDSFYPLLSFRSITFFRWNFFLSNGANWERGEIMVFNQIRIKESDVSNK